MEPGEHILHTCELVLDMREIALMTYAKEGITITFKGNAVPTRLNGAGIVVLDTFKAWALRQS